MSSQDFDNIMDAWADRETGAAPELRPTADLYRLVRARAKRPSVFRAHPRWALAGAALTSLAVLVILYTALFHPAMPWRMPPGQQVALVGQREGFVAEPEVVVRATAVPPKRGPKKEPVSFDQLMFQFQKRGSRFVEGIDLRAPQEEKITLTSADNYRLVLEPVETCYIYAFQLTASGALVQLFPGEAVNSVQNPLRPGQTTYLPEEPNWFYLSSAGRGEERLYVVASAQPLPDLEDLADRYTRTADEPSRQEILTSLLQTLESIGEAASVWRLVFNHG